MFCFRSRVFKFFNFKIKAEADAQATTSSGDSNDLRAANQRIAELEKSLEKSRREIEKINRNWEKRFRILRTSMHEIKNESFVRRRLEYQPMALHTAKMNYRAGFTLIWCPHKNEIKLSPQKGATHNWQQIQTSQWEIYRAKNRQSRCPH